MTIKRFLKFLLSEEIKLVSCLQAREGDTLMSFSTACCCDDQMKVGEALETTYEMEGRVFVPDNFDFDLTCEFSILGFQNLENLADGSWSIRTTSQDDGWSALLVSSSRPLGNGLLWNQLNKPLHN